MKKFWVPALGLAATSLLGCQVYHLDGTELSKEYATVAEVKSDWSYGDRLYISAKDTFWDIFDVLSVDASFGDGFVANAHATRFLNLGMGWFDGICWGTIERGYGRWSERGFEYGMGPFYWKNLTRQPIYGNRSLFEKGIEYEGFELDQMNKDGEKLDLGARLHLAYLGLDVNASPKELLDLGVSVVELGYHLVLWPVNWALDLDPPMIDLSDDDELAHLERELGTQSAQVYQGSSPFLERVGQVFPPVRKEGERTSDEVMEEVEEVEVDGDVD